MTSTEPAPAPPATFADLQDILARTLPGYRRRPQQEALAEGIEQVLASAAPHRHLLAQAGTGTGKSLGALIPAIIAAHRRSARVVVATSTIALMTQYIEKDLPFLTETLTPLGIPVNWAPLKGTSNFLCLSKMGETSATDVPLIHDLFAEIDPEGKGEFPHSGDKNRIATPIDHRRHWPLLSTTSEECPGRSHCSLAAKCFVYRHKDEAADASIVVTNTAVVLTDLKIHQETRDTSETGEGVHVLLNEVDAYIIDEAHEFEDVATQHLGLEIRQGGITRWADQVLNFINTHNLKHDTKAQQQADLLDSKLQETSRKLAEAVIADRTGDKLVFDDTVINEHGQHLIDLTREIESFTNSLRKTKVTHGDTEKAEDTKTRLKNTGESYVRNLTHVLDADDTKVVRWAEVYARTNKYGDRETQTMIRTAPIEVADYLREELWSQGPAVLMSATLSAGTNGNFRYIAGRLGLVADTTYTIDVGTPFDYGRQALLYTPAASVPSPARDTRTEWEIWAPELTIELVRAAGGGAMLLYTSRDAMNRAHGLLADRLAADGIRSLLQHGELTNRQIAKEFREDENSVLFGLRSFMTGVDFPGRCARLVVVDKLPFSVPTDPIVAARNRAVERRGGKPFFDLEIPSMTLTLQQAYGRLIRSTSDWGVVAVLDSRLVSKGYGGRIVRSLPPSPHTTSLDDVRTYFDAWEAAPKPS